MSRIDRDEMADLLEQAKRKNWPRANHERIGFDLEPVDPLNRDDWAECAYVLAELDRLLRNWTVSEGCPVCGFRWWSWGIQHGVGRCDRCGVATLVYVFLYDERPDAICAPVNGSSFVCGKPKIDHVAKVLRWVDGDGSAAAEVSLRCPDDQSRRWTPPKILRLVRHDLWAHPYTLHMKPAKVPA